MGNNKTGFELQTNVLIPDKNGIALCMCNNCMTVLQDMNTFNSTLYKSDNVEIEEMTYYGGCVEHTDKDLIGAWVCPKCMTDEYLMTL